MFCFFSLKKLEFDNYEVDQVVGRKKIRSLATSCFNDKLVFWQLLGASFWSIWFVGFFGRGLSFLSIGQYHFIFFYFHEIYLFFVFSHNLFQKRFLLESLVCCVIHYTEILRVPFFSCQLYFEGLKVTRFLANVFYSPI